MQIRTATLKDKSEWCRMRNILWTDSSSKHLEEIERYFSKDKTNNEQVFVLDRSNNKLGGFLELGVRNYAEGSKANEVPYVEGWYIDSDLRSCGYGKQLIYTAEKWAKKNGFSELASDAELNNSIGIAVHKALGFKEAERLVCFIKKLT